MFNVYTGFNSENNDFLFVIKFNLFYLTCYSLLSLDTKQHFKTKVLYQLAVIPEASKFQHKI